MSEYVAYCDRGHRSYRHLAGVGTPANLARATACLVEVPSEPGTESLNGPSHPCGADLELFRLPPVRVTRLLRAKYAVDGWAEYWSWPGPKFLAARYTDPLVLEEDPERWRHYVELLKSNDVDDLARDVAGPTNAATDTEGSEPVHGSPANPFVHASFTARTSGQHTFSSTAGGPLRPEETTWEARRDRVLDTLDRASVLRDGDRVWVQAQLQKLKVLSTHANMGLATTRELLAELAARARSIEPDGQIDLDYRPVGPRRETGR